MRSASTADISLRSSVKSSVGLAITPPWQANRWFIWLIWLVWNAMKPSENLGMPTSHAIIHGPWYPMVSHGIPWYPNCIPSIVQFQNAVARWPTPTTESSASPRLQVMVQVFSRTASRSWWACRWKAGPHQENHQIGPNWLSWSPGRGGSTSTLNISSWFVFLSKVYVERANAHEHQFANELRCGPWEHPHLILRHSTTNNSCGQSPPVKSNSQFYQFSLSGEIVEKTSPLKFGVRGCERFL